MPSMTTTALAVLFVFGSASAVLADTNNRTDDHHGSVARRAVPVTTSNGRIGAVNHAVKPFTAEEKGWFDRASRVF